MQALRVVLFMQSIAAPVPAPDWVGRDPLEACFQMGVAGETLDYLVNQLILYCVVGDFGIVTEHHLALDAVNRVGEGVEVMKCSRLHENYTRLGVFAESA